VTDRVKHDSQALSLLLLGLLSDREARATEAHLAHCADCCAELQKIRDTVELLDENVPPETWMTERANPDDLIITRALRTARNTKRSQDRHRLLRPLAAAAVVLLVALSGAFSAGRATAPDPTTAILDAAGARTVHGSGPSGASVQATFAPAPSGDTVALMVTAANLPRGAHCQLVVVTSDGHRELAGSWTVPPAGAAPIGAIRGSAAVNIAQVRALAVNDADTGHELAYLSV